LKAFLLSAGLGTRLRPITEFTPKCLVELNGLPLLHYWLKLFEFHKINEILINTHYLNKSVEKFCNSYIGPLNIKLQYEKKLLGSFGTIIKNRKFIKGVSHFLICYADNLTNVNLTEMINFHSNNDNGFTMGLFQTLNPIDCGIVETDDDNVVSFIEKPKQTNSNIANAGIYVVSSNIILESVRNYNEPIDISECLIPSLIGRKKFKGYKINDFIMDIGTLDNYYLANDILKRDSSLFKAILNNNSNK